MIKMDFPQRKLNRMRGYNYDREGDYFVSIDIDKMKECLGRIVSGKVHLNDYGQIVKKYWALIPRFYKNVKIDEYVVMPNHVHGIIHIIEDRMAGGTEQCSVRTAAGESAHLYGLLSKIEKAFKASVVKEIRQEYGDIEFRWQRSFHDQIIRHQGDLERVRKYIKDNPANWKKDMRNS